MITLKKHALITFWTCLAFVVVIIVLLLPEAIYKKGFETIDDVKIAVQHKKEFAPVENLDLRAPSWENYHLQTIPSFLTRKIYNVFNFIGMKKHPVWSPSYFIYMLEKLIDQRKKKNYEPEHVLRLVPSPQARFVVWGDLGGAFHSLTRDLEKLIALKIVNKNLTLASPNDYMVFTGDVVNRSPFIMETLSLIFAFSDNYYLYFH